MTPEPVRPLPAATLVPMRDGDEGLEVLLLRRSDRAAFVPGGYVFPGGVVDGTDASTNVLALVRGLTPAGAAVRLGLRDAEPPAIAYFVAAVRETFEETGLLVGVLHDESGAAPSHADPKLAEARGDLLEGRLAFAEVLARSRAHVAADELAYFAHWITPEGAPRRYDTRFFAARVRRDAGTGDDPQAATDPREMTAALWTTPAAALRALEAGTLRMIRPTIETLRQLSAHGNTEAAMSAMARATVTTKGFDAGPAEARLAEP